MVNGILLNCVLFFICFHKQKYNWAVYNDPVPEFLLNLLINYLGISVNALEISS